MVPPVRPARGPKAFAEGVVSLARIGFDGVGECGTFTIPSSVLGYLLQASINAADQVNGTALRRCGCLHVFGISSPERGIHAP